MTDSPVTPRTEAGRVLRDRLLSMFRAWEQMAAQATIHVPTIEDPAGFILAIEREAGSTDALRAALKHILYRARSHREIMDTARAALAASDAGEAWVESVVGEPGMYASDAGPVRIDVERLAKAIRDEGGVFRTRDDRKAAERILDRLSRESDR
jgi:hypothetical protein